MGFGSKCSIFNGQVIYIEKSKLKIATCDSFSLIVSHLHVLTHLAEQHHMLCLRSCSQHQTALPQLICTQCFINLLVLDFMFCI